MTTSVLQPETIQKLGSAAYPAFAMIAGMQLDLFTPLGSRPMGATQLAGELGVEPARLTPLLYALVTAGLLTVEEGLFSSTPEADSFLVKGKPTYLGGRHAFYTARYKELQQTAASIRAGSPQAKLDFASMPPEAMGDLPARFASRYQGFRTPSGEPVGFLVLSPSPRCRRRVWRPCDGCLCCLSRAPRHCAGNSIRCADYATLHRRRGHGRAGRGDHWRRRARPVDGGL